MEHPRQTLPRTGLDLLLDLLALAGAVSGAALVAYHVRRLPATVPIRLNFGGSPVASGSKHTLWMLPGIALLLCALLAALSRVPHLHNYPVPITDENAERQYRNSRRALQVVNIICAWMLTALTWEIIVASQTGAAPVTAVWFFLAALLIVVGLFVLRAWRLR